MLRYQRRPILDCAWVPPLGKDCSRSSCSTVGERIGPFGIAYLYFFARLSSVVLLPVSKNARVAGRFEVNHCPSFQDRVWKRKILRGLDCAGSEHAARIVCEDRVVDCGIIVEIGIFAVTGAPGSAWTQIDIGFG